MRLALLVPLGPNPASFTELVWSLHRSGERVDEAIVLLESEEALAFWMGEAVGYALPQLERLTGRLDCGWEVLDRPEDFPERLFEHLRLLQSRNERVLVALSAGRWRGATAHTAAVFQLLARPTDRLLDVRVDRVAEGGTGFFFPDQDHQQLEGVGKQSGRTFQASEVGVRLEEQRVPRLRPLLGSVPDTFEDALHRVEQALAPVQVRLDRGQQQVWFQDTQISLSPSGFALYSCLLVHGPTAAWDTDRLKTHVAGLQVEGVLGVLARGEDLGVDQLQLLSQNWSRLRARVRQQALDEHLPLAVVPVHRRQGGVSTWSVPADKLVEG